MDKTETKKKLLKACGSRVYHVTSERYLNKLLVEGLTNFWFGIDLDDCVDMVELSHPEFIDEQQIVVVIPTKVLEVDRCEFKYDSGDGWSDEWFGTGFYNGTIKSSDFKIYDLN